MHKNVIDQAVLNSQRESIQPGICPITSTSIHIVSSEYDLFAETLVIKRQQRSIKELELVVP